MVLVDLSPEAFARLQKLSTPLFDMSSVVVRLADFYETSTAERPKTSSPSAGAASSEFDPASPPDLRHTKLLSAELNGKQLINNKWNALMIEAIRIAKTRAKGADELRRLIIVPFRASRKEDEGYKYLPDMGLSVQGQDASSAWKAAYHIAKQLGFSIKAEFVWRHKDDAAFPGKAGVLAG